MSYQRVVATPEAQKVIEQLKQKHQSELIFHQSGGCCDGSQPMCYVKGDFKIGASDVWLARVEGCDFFMSRFQYEYWMHTHLTLDLVEGGRGSSFSIEIPLGVRFVVRSRLFTEEEISDLEPVKEGSLFETY